MLWFFREIIIINYKDIYNMVFKRKLITFNFNGQCHHEHHLPFDFWVFFTLAQEHFTYARTICAGKSRLLLAIEKGANLFVCWRYYLYSVIDLSLVLVASTATTATLCSIWPNDVLLCTDAFFCLVPLRFFQAAEQSTVPPMDNPSCPYEFVIPDHKQRNHYKCQS